MRDIVTRSPLVPEKGGTVSSKSSVELRTRSYRPDIDGLRSLAVLSVILYHAGVKWIPGGFTGVDVFFAISGYLIGGHIYSELASRSFRFSTFYRNRAKRILPALYTVLVTVMLVGIVLLSPHELRDLAKYTFFTIASASNILFWHTTGYFAPNSDQSPLLMTWSLGVEEQFYLIVPVLLMLIAKRRRQLIFPVVIFVSVLSFCIATYQVSRRPNTAFYLLTGRAWELGIGVALAVSEIEGLLPVPQKRLNTDIMAWGGLLLVIVPFFTLSSETSFPGPAALASVLGASLLLSSSGAWVNRKVLSLPPLVFIGRVSYSFYLVHWPLLAFLCIILGKALPEAWGLAAVAVAFIFAVQSYYFVEKPFRSSTLATGPLLWRYAAMSAVLLLVSGLIYQTNGISSRYHLAGTIDAAAALNDGPSHDVCLAKSGTNLPILSPLCIGADSREPVVALWGDSHASAVAAALRQASASQGYSLEEFAKTSCPPLYRIGRSYRSQSADLNGCVNFNDVVFHRLLVDPQVNVIVLFAYWDGAFDPRTDQGKLAQFGQNPASITSQAQGIALLERSLTETISALLAAHKEVIVFGDTPVFNLDPLWRMRSQAIPLRRRLLSILTRKSDLDPGLEEASDDTPPQIAARTLMRQTVLAIPGARFWDARTRLCADTGLCAYRDGSTPLYADQNHLTRQGAIRVIKDLDLKSK